MFDVNNKSTRTTAWLARDKPAHSTFTCSKSAIETTEKCVKYIQT